jgi:Toastrack DUF4097
MGKYMGFVVVATLLGVSPALAGEWQHTYAVSGVPSFSLDADDAGVQVSGWDRNEISVRIVSDHRIGTGERLRVTDSQNGNEVSVRLTRPHHLFHIEIQWRETKVEVKVPRHAHLDIRTGDGSCDVDGIEGAVAVESGDGAIRAEDVTGRMRFDTADGRIRGSGLRGELDARTSDGRIEVYGTFSRLDLSTSDGAIVAGAGPGSKVGDGWRLQTSDGPITLRIPADLAARLEAHTDDGRVHVPSDLEQRGEIESHYAHLDLNGGGGSIRLRTGDGSIRIERDRAGSE